MKSAVLDYLAFRRIYTLRINSGTQMATNAAGARYRIMMAPAGTADILASPVMGGVPVFLWIETKAPGGKLSEYQKQFKLERERDGHFYLVAFSSDDVHNWLAEYGS